MAGIDRLLAVADKPKLGLVRAGHRPLGYGDAMPKQIVRQAPYLRRYARALTGSQAAGDGLVQQMMEQLLGGAVKLSPNASLRTSLYAALVASWRAGLETAAPPTGESAADQHLQMLDPERRAALLLVAMEGFDVGEAAQIMGVEIPELERRLAAAHSDLEAEMTTDVLIIEDEPIIALDLTRVVRELGHRVSSVAATRDEAVAAALQARPGLVLADVRLADGSNGMDAAADIVERFDVPVIFITAFPEHLLTGDRPEPAFLITKPFREDAVKAMIGQALFFHTPQRQRRMA